MNYACARAALAELKVEATACRRLWACVVKQMLLDAKHDDEEGAAARAWLLCPDPVILEFAGLNPAAAIPRLRAIADGQVAVDAEWASLPPHEKRRRRDKCRPSRSGKRRVQDTGLVAGVMP